MTLLMFALMWISGLVAGILFASYVLRRSYYNEIQLQRRWAEMWKRKYERELYDTERLIERFKQAYDVSDAQRIAWQRLHENLRDNIPLN